MIRLAKSLLLRLGPTEIGEGLDNRISLHIDLSGNAYRTCARVGIWLFKNYSWRFIGILLLTLLAYLLENFGLILLVPLFGIAAHLPEPAENANTVQAIFQRGFELVGIPFSLTWVLLVFCLSIYAKSLLTVVSAIVQATFSLNLLSRIRVELMRSLMLSSWSFAKGVSPGKFANLASYELHRVMMAFNGVIYLSVAIVAALTYLAAAAALNWFIVVGLAFVVAIAVVIGRPLMAYSYNVGFRMTQELNRLIELMVQTIYGLKVLKAMDAQGRALKMIGEANSRNIRARFQDSLAGMVLKRSQEPIIATVLALVIYIGTVSLNVDIAVLAVLIVILIRLSTTVWSIQQNIQQLGNMSGSISSVFGLMNSASNAREEARPDGKQIVFNDRIAYEAVLFSYDDTPILENVNLEVMRPGLTVLTGPSGAGKTTIVDGLLRFVPCHRGRITVDGVDIKDLDVSFWRSQIGYLPQEVLLFTETVRRNVTLGDNSISDEAVIAALRKAGIWDFIEACPGRLDYQVAESGNNLSGGQRQRIALARALVRDAHLLILDEATSALDEANRVKIIDTISTLARSIAVLAVTHDEALVKAANRVYLIDSGTSSPAFDVHRAVVAT